MKKKMSLSNKVVTALITGILCGIIFGDICSYLNIFCDAFIRIMQITVIPYIIVSLLLGLGTLTKKQAKSVAAKGSIVLVSLWLITIVIFFSMQFTFSTIKSASFYNSTTSHSNNTNILDLFIPSNPFASLSNSAIPAIVIFCVLLGISFINTKSKHKVSFINFIILLQESLEYITKMLITIIPYGTFIVTAYIAGTITPQNLEVLAIFLSGHIICSLLITFLIIPLIVSSVTKFTYYDILSETKGIIIFTFVTGNLFISLPLIIESIKQIYMKYGNEDEYVDAQTQTLVPIFFSFPVIGKFTILFFILFSAWLYGIHLGFFKQIELASIGLFTLFGSPYYAIPFILNYLEIPGEAFELYISISQITRKFALILDVIGLFSCTLITISFSTGLFKIRIHKLLRSIIITVITFIFVIFLLRLFFSIIFTDLHTGNENIKNMIMPRSSSGQKYSELVSVKVYKEIPPHLLNSNIDKKNDVLEQILKRKVLRVGYDPSSVPFNYFNKEGNLVGSNIQMAYELAIFMNCYNIEFIPVKYNNFEKILNTGICDIIMAPVAITPERLNNVTYSSSYLNIYISIIIKSSEKEELNTIKKINRTKNFKIAILNGSSFEPFIRKIFPKAEIIKVEALKNFFIENKFDALVSPSYEGFTYTLLYPEYSVFKSKIINNFRQPLAYPIAKNRGESFRILVNSWLDMNIKNNQIKNTYEYWTLGKENFNKDNKRWSILGNVLHIIN